MPTALLTAPATYAPLVIAHRGASGYRPEHTLAGYELAARMGADYLEPDLVSTADGVLVARHEPMIGDTTDVAAHPEFAGRRTVRQIDGRTVEGWFADDFTLAELRTLRAVERLPHLRQENTVYDGLFTVPTLDEILELRARLSAELGREIGVYPETKNPTYFAGRGLPCEPALVAALRAHGLDRADAPVFVQSFETANLRALHEQVPVRLIQLLDDAGAPADLVAAGDPRTFTDLTRPGELAAIAEYAAGIGPAKELVIPPDRGPTTLVADAHAAGLLVHAFTFRNENSFLPDGMRRAGREADHGDVFAEYRAFHAAGVDGVFTDYPDTAVAAFSL
ncbi:glycerophosphodiester phosphodiesterase [Pseudonocardia sp. RS010]|uniref:glycerophosphodiester phosphodiesterase n=1 Tax=Pseudonocardia sp. RS010 TaxID=3385979 RepID=UPI0039A1C360